MKIRHAARIATPETETPEGTALTAIRPPRIVIGVQIGISVCLGMQWMLLPNSHSQIYAFYNLRHIGHFFIPGHPMWFWGILFLTIAAVKLVGIVMRSTNLTGYACFAAMPMYFIYGTLEGFASARHLDTIANNNGTYTILIAFIGLAVWNFTSAVMLLNRKSIW